MGGFVVTPRRAGQSCRKSRQKSRARCALGRRQRRRSVRASASQVLSAPAREPRHCANIHRTATLSTALPYYLRLYLPSEVFVGTRKCLHAAKMSHLHNSTPLLFAGSANIVSVIVLSCRPAALAMNASVSRAAQEVLMNAMERILVHLLCRLRRCLRLRRRARRITPSPTSGSPANRRTCQGRSMETLIVRPV